MRKKFMWTALTLFAVLIIGGASFFAYKFLTSEDTANIQDKPTPEQQAIIDTEFNTKETIATDDLSTYTDIYTMMHEMANGKIIAEDGMIWGVQPMTKDRIVALRAAMQKEDPQHQKIFEILDRWERQDFSHCVEDHNYIWSCLNGNVGRAVRLR